MRSGNDNVGLFYSWAITGNWMWQALVFSHGGTMMSADEKTVAFDKEPGKKSIELLGRMVKRRRHARPDARKRAAPRFFAGKLAIWTESTSLLRVADDGVAGKFKWRTARFPVPGPNAKLPTGGASALMFATEPGQAGGGLEVHEVHHRGGRRHHHGQGHAATCRPTRCPPPDAGDAEGLLCRDSPTT